MTAYLEHANITVSDPQLTAAWLCDVFGWHVRWSGAAKNGGHTVHVGSDDSYLALYTAGATAKTDPEASYHQVAALNHVAMVVDDLALTEQRVKAHGFVPTNHADYEPGRRFYFHDRDGIEFEVVSYA